MIATVREVRGFITLFLPVVWMLATARAYRGPYPEQKSGVADRTLTADCFGRTGLTRYSAEGNVWEDRRIRDRNDVIHT